MLIIQSSEPFLDFRCWDRLTSNFRSFGGAAQDVTNELQQTVRIIIGVFFRKS